MASDQRSIQELFAAAFSQVGGLLRAELRLARAEVSESVGAASYGLGMMAGGALLATAALVLLLLAISSWLVEAGEMSLPGAQLLTALLAIAAAAGLAWAGISRIKTARQMSRTVEQVERDAAAVKERFK